MTKGSDDNIVPIKEHCPEKLLDIPSEKSDNLTDIGNAKLFAELHGSKIRYIEDEKRWINWNGSYWQKVNEEILITKFAKGVTNEIYIRASSLSGDARINMVDHAKKSEAVSRIKAMIQLVKAEPYIAIKSSKLNAAPNLVNFKNGTLDLNEEEFRNHSASDFITFIIDCEFSFNAHAIKFLKCLDQWTGNDPVLIEALQIVLGSALFGGNPQELFIVLKGPGGSGKSTFIGAIQDAIGPYAGQMSPDSFYSSKYDRISADIALMEGKRLVHVSELDNQKKINSAFLKQITGGDKIQVRELYKNPREFKPEFTLVISTNDYPQFNKWDSGIDRRMVVVVFNYQVPHNEFDITLKTHLRLERAGIIAWLYQGYLKGKKMGSKLPSPLTRGMAKEAIKKPTIETFLNTFCNYSQKCSTSAKDLYVAYNSYCADLGEIPITKKEFSSRLDKKGDLLKERKNGGNIYWSGIGLIQNENDDDGEDGF